MLSSGQIVDRYEVHAMLGQGGMAAVYRVRHTRLEVDRALKILTITHPGVRQRLLLEGRVQASLVHPNVVGVTDVIEVGGQPGLLMEYVAGPSMQEWLRRYTPTLDEGLSLFREIAAGVAYAHQRDLIHRDLKPANVLILRRGDALVAKVADFGLAKVMADELGDPTATRTGMGMGTPAYMAPEQVRDAKRVDRRADIFALGCLLYELVTGQRAFLGDDLLSLLSAVAAGRYRPPLELVPHLPEGVDEAIHAALQTDPELRLPSVEALLAMLPYPAPFTWSDEALEAASPPPELPLPIGLPTSSSQHGTLAPTSTVGAAGTWMPMPEPEPAPAAVTSGDSFLRTGGTDAPAPAPAAALPRWLGPVVAAVVVLAVGGWAAGQLRGPPAPTGVAVEAQTTAPGTPAQSTPPQGTPAQSTPAPATQAPTDPLATDPLATDPLATDPLAAGPATPQQPGGAGSAAEGPGAAPAQPAAVRPATQPASQQGTSTAGTGTAGAGTTSAGSSAPAQPAATPAQPASTPAAAPAPEQGTVRVTGDALSVELRSTGGRYAPGSVPAGTYDIIATFPGRDPASAGQVTVPPGTEVVLRCTAAFVKCVH